MQPCQLYHLCTKLHYETHYNRVGLFGGVAITATYCAVVQIASGAIMYCMILQPFVPCVQGGALGYWHVYRNAPEKY